MFNHSGKTPLLLTLFALMHFYYNYIGVFFDSFVIRTQEPRLSSDDRRENHVGRQGWAVLSAALGNLTSLSVLCGIKCAGFFAGGIAEVLVGGAEDGLALGLLPFLGYNGAGITKLDLQ